MELVYGILMMVEDWIIIIITACQGGVGSSRHVHVLLPQVASKQPVAQAQCTLPAAYLSLPPPETEQEQA